MPDLDQSVARQVVLDLSNILTPSSISLTMVDFEALNDLSRFSVHSNFEPDFNNSLNGSIIFVLLKA